MTRSTKLLGGVAYVAMIVLYFFSIVVIELYYFSFATPFAYLFMVVGLVAALCAMVAFVRAGSQLSRPDVIHNAVAGAILYLLAGGLVIGLFATSLSRLLEKGGAGLGGLGAIALVVAVLCWLLVVVAAGFWYQAARGLAEATRERRFRTGSLLVFVGSIFSVVLVGLIGVIAGSILVGDGFFKAPVKDAAGDRKAA